MVVYFLFWKKSDYFKSVHTENKWDLREESVGKWAERFHCFQKVTRKLNALKLLLYVFVGSIIHLENWLQKRTEISLPPLCVEYFTKLFLLVVKYAVNSLAFQCSQSFSIVILHMKNYMKKIYRCFYFLYNYYFICFMLGREEQKKTCISRMAGLEFVEQRKASRAPITDIV